MQSTFRVYPPSNWQMTLHHVCARHCASCQHLDDPNVLQFPQLFELAPKLLCCLPPFSTLSKCAFPPKLHDRLFLVHLSLCFDNNFISRL
jgi:hypothetical protein